MRLCSSSTHRGVLAIFLWYSPATRTMSYIIVLMSLLQEEVSRFLEAWMRVRQVVQAANFNQFHRAGLSATQFMSLNVIPEEGLTLSEIARTLNLSAASLKKTIDSLAERGLVVRKPRGSDGRKIDILSTSAGKRLQNSASGEFHTFIAGIFGRMSHKDRRGLVTGLEQFLQLAGQHAQEQETSATRLAGGAARGKHSTRQSR
jgi:DNA-binding MarR family transcriptional regulator